MGARSGGAEVSGTGQGGSDGKRERKRLLHVTVHHKLSHRLGGELVSTDSWINGDEAQGWVAPAGSRLMSLTFILWQQRQ